MSVVFVFCQAYEHENQGTWLTEEVKIKWHDWMRWKPRDMIGWDENVIERFWRPSWIWCNSLRARTIRKCTGYPYCSLMIKVTLDCALRNELDHKNEMLHMGKNNIGKVVYCMCKMLNEIWMLLIFLTTWHMNVPFWCFTNIVKQFRTLSQK